MFGFFGKKRINEIENETKKSFDSVRKDFEGVGKWIKHLNEKNKLVYHGIHGLTKELSSIKFELESLKESMALIEFAKKDKQLSKKQTPVYKQPGVYGVQTAVQTAVQTGDFYDFLQGLSANERLIVFTLMNATNDMKLSYEDLARLLGKERSTVRGQINRIKQKSEGLIQELTEPNGKKRVFIGENIKEKLQNYAKVRLKKKTEDRKKGKNSEE